MKSKFRSKFEKSVITEAQKHLKSKILYEDDVLEYLSPAKKKKYTPDVTIKKSDGSKIYIELKGRFHNIQERQKYEHVLSQYPDMDLRFVFQNPKLKIYKSSKTTYSEWADKNNITWADGHIPISWFSE